MGSRANLLVVLPSQWRWHSLGFSGDPCARTPVLDGLARGGVFARSAVATHPFPPQSKAAWLTARRSPGNGVAGYYDPLPPRAPTWVRALAEAGWQTAHVGKWQLGRRDRALAPVNTIDARRVVPPGERGGFAFWESFEAGFQIRDPWLHGTLFRDPVRFDGYQGDVLVDRVLRFLREDAREPWLVVLHADPPHPPYETPAPGVEARDPASVTLRPNVPRGGEVEAKARRELAGYHAHLEAMDAAIGRLLEGVEELGWRRSTLVAVTSNHGDMHGSHGLFRKGWPHAESLRVPLILSWPEGLPCGVVSDAPVGLVDFGPTVLALVGAGGFAGDGVDCTAELREGAAGRDAVPVSLPEGSSLPLQCDQPWEGEAGPAVGIRVRWADGRRETLPWD